MSDHFQNTISGHVYIHVVVFVVWSHVRISSIPTPQLVWYRPQYQYQVF